VGHVFSGTDESNMFFSKFFPSSFIFNDSDLSKYIDEKDKNTELYNKNAVVQFKERQILARNYLLPNNTNPWAIEVFDDCTADPKYLKKPIIQDLYKNGRHWMMMHISTYQFCLDLPSNIRSNVNGIFIMKEGNPNQRERLFKNFSDGGIDKYEFDYIMDEITEDWTSMYINKRSVSSRIDDTIMYYKADLDVVKDFKFGSKEFWDFHYQRVEDNNRL